MNQREAIEREYVSAMTFASAFKDVMDMLDRAIGYIDQDPEKAKETLQTLRGGFETLHRHREFEARNAEALLGLDDEMDRLLGDI